MARERGARRRRVALVEDQIDHAQHGVEALRQLGALRHLVRDAGVADLGFRPDDPLRHRRCRGQERPRDLLGGQSADFTQREGHLRVGLQRRVAAGEDQPEPVVVQRLLAAPFDGRGGLSFQLGGQRGERRVEARPPPQCVDGLEPSGGHQPRPRAGRYAVARPLFEGGREGVVERLFGAVEVAEQADQGGEHPARLGPVDRVDAAPDVGNRVLAAPNPAHRPYSNTWIGRTSTVPSLADGMRDAT